MKPYFWQFFSKSWKPKKIEKSHKNCTRTMVPSFILKWFSNQRLPLQHVFRGCAGITTPRHLRGEVGYNPYTPLPWAWNTLKYYPPPLSKNPLNAPCRKERKPVAWKQGKYASQDAAITRQGSCSPRGTFPDTCGTTRTSHHGAPLSEIRIFRVNPFVYGIFLMP